MKYMKLGSKPDIFQTSTNTVSILSELASDITFQVEETTFHLHKFPLLSKCITLQRLAVDTMNEGVIQIADIPGGVKAFELCAKFCYGITITLNAYNVMTVRYAAEYLGMTESIDKGNLVFKLEVFLTSSIFKSWKDSIIALKTTKPLLPYSQDLKMISRCVDSISSKTSVDPSKVDWSYTYTRKQSKSEITTTSPVQNGAEGYNHHHRHTIAPKDWWVEDICDLDIDFYSKVMMAIKTKGRMSHKLVGEALRVYAYRWLPGVSKEHSAGLDLTDRGKNPSHQLAESTGLKHKMLLETIVSLMPNEKGSCSCSLMLRLLKAATILGVDATSKMDLARRVGLQLDEASLNDILIPSLSYANDTLYDVDLMHCIVEHFLLQYRSSSCSSLRHGRTQQDYEKRRSLSADHLEYLAHHACAASSQTAKIKVAKLIDGYLAEIARDLNLSLAKFVTLAETVPEFARPVHDGLYRAIDIYLKEHPALTKGEKKRLCRLMDCKKLSMDACVHAAQNERLPLRVVVQVLFFEQVRTAMTGGLLLNDLPNNVKALLPQAESSSDDHVEDGIVQDTAHSHEEEWDSVNNGFNALKGDVAEMKCKMVRPDTMKNSMPQQEVFMLRQSKAKTLLSNSKKLLNRLLSVKYGSSVGSKDSDISRSSGSSVSSVPSKVEVDHTTTRNVIRRRRHSIS